MKQTDLWGEPDIRIADNPALEAAARHILSLVRARPELIDGNTIGEVDRVLRLAVWMEEGLSQILSPDQVEAFREWSMDSKRCVDPELVRRARQYLVQHDFIRLSGTAIKEGERQRARLSQSFRSRG